MARLTKASATALALLITMAASQAQDKGQDQTIRVTTRLVQVTAIVRDKKGPVADLTKKDFEIIDGGKKRDIATFSVYQASDRSQRATLPPNTFSNHLDQTAESPVAATVILFDSLNTQFKDQASARQQTLAYLKAIDPQSPVAIYALGNKLNILHDFTDDRALLARALERYRTKNSQQLSNSNLAGITSEAVSPSVATSGGIRSTDGTVVSLDAPAAPVQGQVPLASISTDMIAQILEPLASYANDRRIAMTVTAMQVIANRLSGVRGRKNLIWISGGFPIALAFDGIGGLAGGGQRAVTYAGPVREAAIAIDRANVAIYPVDARGLKTEDNVKVEVIAARDQRGLGTTNNQTTAEQMIGGREIETMKLLADWTGGKAFYNTNDIRDALKQASEDAEVTYTLGFYVDEKDLDGSYHELKVKVDRKGAEARSRRGYFASAVPAATSQGATDILTNAVFAPADATGIGLTASLAPNPQNAGSYLLALGMDLSTLRLEEKNNKWTGGINFGIIQQAADGKVLDTVSNNISLNITDENRKALLRDGLVLRLAITPAPGMTQIRTAVMDQLSGNAGSLRITPPLK